MKSGSMLWLAGALLLGGCAQGTVIANRDQVVVEDHTLREAVSLAEQRCGRFGRRAYFESEGRTTHAFSCREPRIDQAAKQRADIAPALGNADVKKSAEKKSPSKTPEPGKPVAETPSQKMPERKMSEDMNSAAGQLAMAMPPSGHADGQKAEAEKTAKPKAHTARHGKGKPLRKPDEIKKASKGTIWVQVASSGKETEAQEAARDFIAQHGDVIGTSSFNIQQASLKNAGTVYRTRVGPYKRFASASNACKALKSRKLECLVVIR